MEPGFSDSRQDPKANSYHLKGEGMNWRETMKRTKLGCLAVLLITVGCQVADTQKGGSKTMNSRNLASEQQAMVEIWERHMAAEFKEKSINSTMATMTSDPFVNHVPVMTGGVGSSEVRHFYGTYFIPGHPPDTEVVPVARTVGDDRIVDELIHKFTHTIEMPWILPGIPPTSKRVEVAVVVVVQFKDGKIAGERIYWDQASVLAQIGLINANKLPVTGAEASRKVLNPAREPSNRLIERMNR
jgi:carboxymethylenebutenolidase